MKRGGYKLQQMHPITASQKGWINHDNTCHSFMKGRRDESNRMLWVRKSSVIYKGCMMCFCMYHISHKMLQIESYNIEIETNISRERLLLMMVISQLLCFIMVLGSRDIRT